MSATSDSSSKSTDKPTGDSSSQKADDTPSQPITGQKTEKSPRTTKRWPRFIGRVVGIIIVIFLLAGIFAYALSPAAIRKPAYQHYHFRMQVVANGQSVDFGHSRFQEGYAKDNCSAELTSRPFHFHDNRDQLVHVHWDHLTGGQLLKYYGWNYTGGLSNTLGYRFDQLPKVQNVPLHGHVLPELANGEQLYIFTGDKQGFKEHSRDDFLKKDFETFFGKQSNLGQEAQTSWLDTLFPKAYAHGGEHHGADGHSEAELEAVNNLLGNVVIFAQKDRPTDDEVQARFARLVPLDASTCGG